MKKLISILMAFAMILAFAAIPAFAAEEEVDFTLEGGNIAAGKTVTISPSGASTAKFNDGDVTTYAQAKNDANGKSWIKIDLGANYMISEVTLYQYSTQKRTTHAYVGMDENNLTDLGEVHGISGLVSCTVEGTTVKKANYLSNGNVIGNYIYIEAEASFVAVEVLVKGTPVTGDVVNFTSAENIAYGAYVTADPDGDYYDSSKPSTTKQWATDGDLSTAHKSDGDFSDNNGVGFKMQLDAVYKVNELTVYLSSNQPNQEFNVYAGVGSQKALVVPASDVSRGEVVSVNGGEYAKYTVTLPNIVAQNIWVEYTGAAGFYYHEVYAKGEAITGLEYSALGEATYADSNVTANMSFANASETEYSGTVYFAAYNGSGALVGFGTAPVALAAGTEALTSAAASVTFAVSEEPTTVKAFYWTDGTLVPIIAPVDLK